MEYEISEEGVLFDSSNNPSLDRSPRGTVAFRRPTHPLARKAEHIPEAVEPA